MKLLLDRTRRRAVVARSNETYMLRDWLRQEGFRFFKGWWEFPLDIQTLEHLERAFNERGGNVEFDASLEEWMQHERNAKQLAEVARLGRNGKPTTDGSLKWKMNPYTHQEIGAYWLTQNRWCMLLDDMGLGKTAQAVTAASNLHPFSVVIVCPNSVKEVWSEEIERFSVAENNLVLVPSGSTKDRERSIQDAVTKTDGWAGIRWIILNYESLRYFEKTFCQAASAGCLICDEAHRLKNGRAQVTKIVESAAPKWFWLLTGTPIANRPEDLWSLMNLVRPGLAGFYWYDFERNYIKRNKFNAIYGYRNLGFLSDKLSRVSLGRKKEDCVDLPEKVFEKRVVDLSSNEAKAYNQMKKTLKAWLDDDVEDPPTLAQVSEFTTRFIRLRQIACGLVSEGRDGKKSWSKEMTKLKTAVAAWADSGHRRCVMWFQYVDVLKKMAEMLTGAPVGLIHGEVTPASRKREIDAWSHNSGGILLCQMDTAGVGLNLQAADLQIFVDLPTTPMQRNQCVDRLHRIGQKNQVTIIDVLAKGTVDETILKRLKQKIGLSDFIESKSYGRTAMREMVE